MNEARRWRFRFRRFYAARRLLIIAIPTATHEVLRATLYGEAIAIILGMGLRLHWGTYGATLYRAANGDAAEEIQALRPYSNVPGPTLGHLSSSKQGIRRACRQ
jgi:hypothetical protein